MRSRKALLCDVEFPEISLRREAKKGEEAYVSSPWCFFRPCPLFAVYGIPAFTTVFFEMIKGCVGVGEEGGGVFTVPRIETDTHTDRNAVAIGVVDLGKTGSDLAATISDDTLVQGVAGKDSEFVSADASGDVRGTEPVTHR